MSSGRRPMVHRGHGWETFGGRPTGDCVVLPAGAREPIRVYINGVEQKRNEDFRIYEGRIVFREPIYKEQIRELSTMRKIGLALGVVGNYERHETVDIEYGTPGGMKLMTNAQVRASAR